MWGKWRNQPLRKKSDPFRVRFKAQHKILQNGKKKHEKKSKSVNRTIVKIYSEWSKIVILLVKPGNLTNDELKKHEVLTSWFCACWAESQHERNSREEMNCAGHPLPQPSATPQKECVCERSLMSWSLSPSCLLATSVCFIEKVCVWLSRTQEWGTEEKSKVCLHSGFNDVCVCVCVETGCLSTHSSCGGRSHESNRRPHAVWAEQRVVSYNWWAWLASEVLLVPFMRFHLFHILLSVLLFPPSVLPFSGFHIFSCHFDWQVP